MALTSTLFTGLSGLDVNQSRMNVTGNNIANVNTVAFKGSRALFRPQFYVTDAGGSAPSAEFGGTNPSQRGLGASVASIQKDFGQGSLEATGKPTDLALEGAGFFVVKGGEQWYTRDGSFVLNSNDELTTSGGGFVQGYGVDSGFNVVPGKLQNLRIPLGAASLALATENVSFHGNLDASGTPAGGASVLNSQLLTTIGGTAPDATSLLTDVTSTAAPGTPLFAAGQSYQLSGRKGGRDLPAGSFGVTAASTLQDLMDFYSGTLGINTTALPAAGEPTPGGSLVADAADPNSARIVIGGNPGRDNALSLASGSLIGGGGAPLSFQDGVNANGIASNPNGESIHTNAVAFDSLGNQVTLDVTAVLESASAAGTRWTFFVESGDNKTPGGNRTVGTGTLDFDTEGTLITTTGNSISVDRAGTGAKTPLGLKLDFAGITALASSQSGLAMSKQDGSPLGSLSSYTIGGDGVITGSFSNGLTRSLGQLAVATFNNPSGLEDEGGNLYAGGADSGAPILTVPAELGAGTIRSGSLELANVDLSKEFVNLIISSTGFSAASRVITTSDQLITELLNSSR